MAKLRIRGARLLVLCDETPKITKGGIVLPDEALRKEQLGTVILVGQNLDGTPAIPDIKPGDRVVFPAYVGQILKLNLTGQIQEYLIMPDSNVVAIMEGNPMEAPSTAVDLNPTEWMGLLNEPTLK